jgi:hypothetical protein
MKIRFIKSPGAFNLAYHSGESGEFPEAQALELIESGFAVSENEESSSESVADSDKKDPETAQKTEHKQAEKAVKPRKQA